MLRNFGIIVFACHLCLAGNKGGGAGCGSTGGSTGSLSAYQRYAQRYGGLDAAQESCLIQLWDHESGWNPSAVEDQPIGGNPPSYAYGIPQANPAYTGGEWGAFPESDPDAQIRWGLGYIAHRWGSPCGAWDGYYARGRWY